ncbi:helix-turn-helix transcriptional regulator [uncultured Clostridium sp.]|uniref:helix-turn-helix transcriptional regulator n=1 Tax=uncultured Clostridium sp. TaxID=59620 RepID=UPI00261F69B4|nr:helix-turn-helix transcriptional regulator [uncultured Clostridium sp.]
MKNNLKIARIAAGLSQEDLGKIIGYTRVTISKIETGKSIPSGQTMLKIAKAIGIPVEEIFFINTVNQD